MWGHTWGEMIWGGGGAVVPLTGPLGIALLALALLSIGALRMRHGSLRRAGWLGLLLVALPLAARAAYDLPHVFQNGTGADAQQVNENFAAITEDFARYVVRVTTPLGESAPIPSDVLDRLCGDVDGCNAKLLLEFPSPLPGGSGIRVGTPGPWHLSYTPTSGVAGARQYTLAGSASNVFSMDGADPFQLHVSGPCALEDFQRIASVSQPDNTLGLWLVNTYDPTAACTLVIDD